MFLDLLAERMDGLRIVWPASARDPGVVVPDETPRWGERAYPEAVTAIERSGGGLELTLDGKHLPAEIDDDVDLWDEVFGWMHFLVSRERSGTRAGRVR